MSRWTSDQYLRELFLAAMIAVAVFISLVAYDVQLWLSGRGGLGIRYGIGIQAMSMGLFLSPVLALLMLGIGSAIRLL